jgi:hypothetical protein
MAITQFADVDEFVKRDIPSSDQTWVEKKIEEAEGILETYVGDLTDWVDVDPSKRTGKVILVVCRMVDRVIKNPDGYNTETDGDYSYGRSGSLASGEVYASRADLRILGVGLRRRFGSVRLHLPSESPRNATGC